MTERELKAMEGKQMPVKMAGQNWWPESYLKEQILAGRKQELEYLVHQEQIHDPNGNPTYGTEWCIPRKVVIDRLQELSEEENE